MRITFELSQSIINNKSIEIYKLLLEVCRYTDVTF